MVIWFMGVIQSPGLRDSVPDDVRNEQGNNINLINHVIEGHIFMEGEVLHGEVFYEGKPVSLLFTHLERKDKSVFHVMFLDENVRYMGFPKRTVTIRRREKSRLLFCVKAEPDSVTIVIWRASPSSPV